MNIKAALRNKTIIVLTILLILIVLSYAIPGLEPFRREMADYGRMIWWAILLGLVIGGFIDRFVPESYIVHLLARRRKRTILHAALLGFLLSACSHGILALGMQLYKKGASTAAVVGFLMASPWANLPLTILLFGFFGLKAFFIIAAALGVGMTTGLIYQVLEKKGWVERQPREASVDDSFSIPADIHKRFRAYRFSSSRLREDAAGVIRGAVSLGDMVLWWLLIGIGLAGLSGAYVPQDFMMTYLGPSLLGLFLTLAVATIIEVCSEGSAPLAFELYQQTGALGNSYTFLMAGVATDFTEIGLLWSNVGHKAALWLPVVTVPQILLIGWLANTFLS